jgi:hypothetical protein
VTAAIAVPAQAAYLHVQVEKTCKGFPMLARLFRRRRQRRYVWSPALKYTNGGVVVALMTFGH